MFVVVFHIKETVCQHFEVSSSRSLFRLVQGWIQLKRGDVTEHPLPPRASRGQLIMVQSSRDSEATENV